MGIISFSGCIRGAVAFGLVIGIQTGNQNDELLVSTTLILVFVTTIVFGALIPLVINRNDLTKQHLHCEEGKCYQLLDNNNDEYKYVHPNNKM